MSLRVFTTLSIFLISILQAEVQNSYLALVQKGLIKQGEKPSLHLGCGENKLEGFINIDFPIEERALHKKQVADFFCDISLLRFPEKTIRCVENHHIFEHFTRSKSIALLCAWHYWLEEGGELLIETPDFEGAIKRFMQEPSYKIKQAIIRHVFGSQEATWAIHYDGWYQEKFISTLTTLGFEIDSCTLNSWSCLDNITVVVKKHGHLSVEKLKLKAKQLINQSRVNNTESEVEMSDGWYEDFLEAFEKMII